MRATRVVPLLALLANSACMDKDPPSAVPIPKGARSSLNAVDVWGKSQISAWNWNCDQSQPNGRVTPMIVQPMDCRDSRLVRQHTASPTPGSLVYQIFDSFADTAKGGRYLIGDEPDGPGRKGPRLGASSPEEFGV